MSDIAVLRGSLLALFSMFCSKKQYAVGDLTIVGPVFLHSLTLFNKETTPNMVYGNVA